MKKKSSYQILPTTTGVHKKLTKRDTYCTKNFGRGDSINVIYGKWLSHGRNKKNGKIKGNFNFPNIFKKVRPFIQGCEKCTCQKSSPKMPCAEF
jgi:hypothetical protein